MSGKLLPLSLECDGMGLADREAAEVDMDTAENLIHDDVADCVSDTSQITIPGIGMKRVRPTTSCDKPPYVRKVPLLYNLQRRRPLEHDMPATRRFAEAAKEIAEVFKVWCWGTGRMCAATR
jgi:hypothetical protein